MPRLTSRMRMVCGAAGLVALMSAVPVSAQPMMGPGGGWGPGGNGWGPGGMMGPGWRGGAMCSPRAAGLASWRIGAIEEIVKPTEAQRAAFDALKEASSKAADAMATACPQEYPPSSSARLEVMEKRLDAMLQAVKTVRPAFDAFYAVLTDEQKRRLDTVSPAGPWRWHMWRWRQSAQ
jgi:LTXXQ motif family protein